MGRLFKKISNLPEGVKASVGFFIANLITSAISYIITPVYTRLLTPDEYGGYVVFATWLQIFGIIAMFNLQHGVFNNGMIEHPDKRNEYSFSMFGLSNVITIIFFAILFALYPFIKDYVGLRWEFLILMLAVFLTEPAYRFWFTRQRFELKYKNVILATLVIVLITQSITLLSVLCTKGSRMDARIYSFQLSYIIIYLIFGIYLAKKSKFKTDTSFWKSAFMFNLPLLPHYLSMYLLGNCDKIMISNIVGESATAYYSIAHSVATISLMLWSSINGALIPYTYEKCKSKDYSSISKITTPILLVFAAVCLCVILLAPEVVWIMADKDYYQAIYVIPPIIGGVFFQIQYYIYANILYYYKKTKYVMYSSLVATILNILLNYIFIKMYGYMAAGYTTLVSYFVKSIMDYLALRKEVKTEVYNMKHIGILSLSVILIALFSSVTYSIPLIRYSLIALIVVAIFMFRKQIAGIFFAIKKRGS